MRPDVKLFHYSTPEEATIDEEIKSICNLINSSGWVWTVESCSGHSENADPYLRLVCLRANVGQLMLYISKCYEGDAIPTIYASDYMMDNKWGEILVYIRGSASLVFKRARLDELAELIKAYSE